MPYGYALSNAAASILHHSKEALAVQKFALVTEKSGRSVLEYY